MGGGESILGLPQSKDESIRKGATLNCTIAEPLKIDINAL